MTALDASANRFVVRFKRKKMMQKVSTDKQYQTSKKDQQERHKMHATFTIPDLLAGCLEDIWYAATFTSFNCMHI